MKNLYLYIILNILFVGNFFSQSSDCDQALPACTNQSYSFPNTTGETTNQQNNNFDCLDDQPNPAWYYFEIEQGGNLVIDIAQYRNNGTPIDVDFILYGPYDNVQDAYSYCGNLGTSSSGSNTNTVIDCSFAPDEFETATVNNAQTGEVYLFLLTNYSDRNGYIEFSTGSGNSASTNCDIVVPCDLRTSSSFIDYNCSNNGGEITLEVNGSDTYDISINGTLTYDDIQAGTYTFSNLQANTYDIEIINIADPACVQNENGIVISQPSCCDVGMTLINSTPADCGLTNGSFEVNITGSSTYNISLDGTIIHSNVSTGNHTLSNLASGTYTISAEEVGNSSCQSTLNSQNIQQLPCCTPPSFNTSAPVPQCGGTIDIANNYVSSTGVISYYTSSNDASNATNSLTGNQLIVDSSTTIYFRIEDPNDNNCYNLGQFEITINQNPFIDIITSDTTVCSTESPFTIITSANNGIWSSSTCNTCVSPCCNEFTPSTNNIGTHIFYYTLTENNCSSIDSISITVTDGPSLDNYTKNDITCYGNNDGIIDFSNGISGGTPPYTFDINSLGYPVYDSTFFNLNAGTYSFLISDDNGCSFLTQTINLDEPQDVTASIDPVNTNDPTCPDIADGQIRLIVSDPTSTIVWSDGSNSNPKTNLEEGTYYYTVIVNNGNCPSIQGEYTLTSPNPISIDLSSTDEGCDGDCQGSISVKNMNSDYIYTTNGLQFVGNTLSNLCKGNYIVEAQSLNSQCIYRDSINVGFTSNPDANFYYNPSSEIYNNTIVKLYNQSIDADRYNWFFDSILYSNKRDTSIDFNNYEKGSYLVCLEAENNNCFDTSCQIIQVDELCRVYIPNSFSPNRDGLNDKFEVSINCYDKYEIVIYDRWGEILFNSRNPYEAWDGKDIKGTPLEAGVYGYKVRVIKNGSGKKYEGKVSIIR